ncbi:MAG: NAD(P)/FAD-dependent oxidoreductase, partial [Bacteroidetes bacterium]
MQDKTIAVLGGGMGGIVAARQLRTLLGRKHRIILVDKSTNHQFAPSFLWSLLGWRKPSEVKKPLSMLKRYNILVRNALVQALHPGQNAIQTNKEVIWYDYLIIALGAEAAYNQVPGLAMATPTFYTLEGADHIASKIRNMTSGKIAILIGGTPHKSPVTPYESALLLDYYYKNLGRKNIQIEIYTPESAPLSLIGKGIDEPILELLKKRGISFFPNHKIANILGGKNEIQFDNGSTITPDQFMVIPPSQPPSIISNNTELLAPNGWIAVDPKTLRTRFPKIFAIGDVTSISLPNGLVLPKTGSSATKQGDVVANILAFELEGAGKIKQFDGNNYSFLEAGNGTAGAIKSKFYDKPAPTISFSKPSMTNHWRRI